MHGPFSLQVGVCAILFIATHTYGTTVRLETRQVKRQPASFRYTFHPFLVTADDKLLVTNNPRHVCQPKIHPNIKPTFALPCTSSIR